MTDSGKPNRLITEQSPYLLQHAHNPVDWYPWGDEAFAEAKRRDVPVFLSVGYSSCHWCHVMERESFENEGVAAALNNNFISVKVDREERPDVDHIYMSACAALTGSGGWPLSCFLSHDRKPFFAGTYFPPDAFVSLLDAVTKQWNTHRYQLDDIGEQVTLGLAAEKKSAPASLGENIFSKAFSHLASVFDKQFGGFGKAPKFPSVHNLLFLLRWHAYQRNSNALAMVEKTLDCMYAGGIFDHIGGGFCRYSTDRQWLVPHFEKMMYDNAMLSMVYVEAGAAIDKKYYDIAKRVFEYTFREMYADGAFYTAQDADSEGEEGKYYLFIPTEVESILGKEDGQKYCRLFDITEKGNFEGMSIPNLLKISEELDKQFAKAAADRLYAERSKRVPPFKDDKYLASVNGLMVAALSKAARLLDDKTYTDKAEGAAEFIKGRMMLAGRLYTGYRKKLLGGLAGLDDYAYVLWGFFELYQATLNDRWLRETVWLADQIIELFHEEGILYLTGKDAEGLPVRTKSVYDGALPAGSSIAVDIYLKLWHVTGEDKYREIAEGVVSQLTGEVAVYPTSFVSLLCAELYKRHGGTHITLSDGEGLDELKKACRGFNPFLTLRLDAQNKLAGGKAAAVICTGHTCLPPTSDAKTIISKVSLNQ